MLITAAGVIVLNNGGTVRVGATVHIQVFAAIDVAKLKPGPAHPGQCPALVAAAVVVVLND